MTVKLAMTNSSSRNKSNNGNNGDNGKKSNSSGFKKKSEVCRARQAVEPPCGSHHWPFGPLASGFLNQNYYYGGCSKSCMTLSTLYFGNYGTID